MTGDTPITPDEFDGLTMGLSRAAQALDGEIAASGAVDRVVGRVMAHTARSPARRSIWFAIAAALIIAAGLGSVADLVFIGARSGSGQEVVVMDPLIFGTTVVGQQ